VAWIFAENRFSKIQQNSAKMPATGNYAYSFNISLVAHVSENTDADFAAITDHEST
jgi:hypothetical protein